MWARTHADQRFNHTDRQTRSDYSGQEFWNPVASGGASVDYGLSRFWIHPYNTETGKDTAPFLFIHNGSARLSGSEFGAVRIKDASTGLTIQSLNHGGRVFCLFRNT